MRLSRIHSKAIKLKALPNPPRDSFSAVLSEHPFLEEPQGLGLIILWFDRFVCLSCPAEPLGTNAVKSAAGSSQNSRYSVIFVNGPALAKSPAVPRVGE